MILAHSPADAWCYVSEQILEKGSKNGSLLEIPNGLVHIKYYRELGKSYIRENFDKIFDEKFREIFGDERIDYASSYTFVHPEKTELGNYVYQPIKKKWHQTYFGRMVNFRGKGINQIESALKQLKRGINTKLCVIQIYDPEIDMRNIYSQPCLISIDLKPRGENLTLTAFFRSMAVSKSGYADFTALENLGTFLAEESNRVLNHLIIHATSLHIRTENKEKTKTKKLLKIMDEWSPTYDD